MSEPLTPGLSPEQSLVMRILSRKARAKEQHDQARGFLAELQALNAGTITLPDGRKFEVIDNFAGEAAKKTIFIDRYELQRG